MTDNDLILITGATGYVGGRLVPRLLRFGYKVRVLVRDAERLRGRPWRDSVEIVQGDVLNPDSLRPALTGVKVAYYLVQSVGNSHQDAYRRKITGARNFGLQAKEAGVDRIVHLGTLTSSYRSRTGGYEQHCAGDALRESGLPVTEYRAAVVVGCGSLTFEMIRYLTERVPIMICPRWVKTRVQPIGITTTIDYLMAALETPESIGKILEIGGPEVLSYREMLLQYAAVRGLRRLLITVPVLTPRLSSYWVHWITPVPASIARSYIDSLRHEAVIKDNSARFMFPAIRRQNYRTAVRVALAFLEAKQVETTWNDALVTSQGDVRPVILTSHEGMLFERRQQVAEAAPEEVFDAFSRIGGDRGWPYMNWAWRLRGSMDRFIGGVGMRRGRRDPDDLRVGDALDFWRVEAVEPGSLLRLRAEMKLPGSAWLQFESEPLKEMDNEPRNEALKRPADMPIGEPGGECEKCPKSRLTQTAFFASKGLLGLLYWYLLYPIHGMIFSGMIRRLVARAEELAHQRPIQGPGDSF